jgi:hypothetical protein
MSTADTPPTPSKASEVENVVTQAVQVAGVLVPEAAPAIALFGLLEPEVQSAIAGMIHKMHERKMTAQDFLDQAAILVNGPAK